MADQAHDPGLDGMRRILGAPANTSVGATPERVGLKTDFAAATILHRLSQGDDTVVGAGRTDRTQ